jgi:hypothetical protein
MIFEGYVNGSGSGNGRRDVEMMYLRIPMGNDDDDGGVLRILSGMESGNGFVLVDFVRERGEGTEILKGNILRKREIFLECLEEIILEMGKLI